MFSLANILITVTRVLSASSIDDESNGLLFCELVETVDPLLDEQSTSRKKNKLAN